MQQKLKEQRDYKKQPRTMHENDLDYRDDYKENMFSLTKQADAESADINNIVQKYLQTGVAPGMQGDPIYGDFSDVNDFQAALEIVASANAQFAGLDANVRSRFGNDPANFLEFVNDKSNLEEMVKMGLAEKRTQKETQEDILKGIRDNTKPSKTTDAATSTASKP